MKEKEALTEEMETSTEELIEEAEKLSKDQFETHKITGVWAAKEILCHVAAWDLVFVELSKKMLKGEPFRGWPDFDDFNAREVSKRKEMSRDEIFKEVGKNRKAYIDFIKGLTDKELQMQHESEGHTFTIKGLAEDIVSHDQYHLQQMRAKD